MEKTQQIGMQELEMNELATVEGGNPVALIALGCAMIYNSGAIGDFCYGLFCGLGGVEP